MKKSIRVVYVAVWLILVSSGLMAAEQELKAISFLTEGS